MTWTEIEILVDKAKQGDRDAFGELTTRFHNVVYVMAMARVRDPNEAEELTQEVFIHAMRKLPQLREARAFASWLRRITARMAINRRTRRGPVVNSDPEMLDVVESRDSRPEKDLEDAEKKASLIESLRSMKPEDRATLEAFYLRGKSLKDMATEFDAPLGTIKRRLHVARHRLKVIIEGTNPDFDVDPGTSEDGHEPGSK